MPAAVAIVERAMEAFMLATRSPDERMLRKGEIEERTS
jgi:hypothetical protein